MTLPERIRAHPAEIPTTLSRHARRRNTDFGPKEQANSRATKSPPLARSPARVKRSVLLTKHDSNSANTGTQESLSRRKRELAEGQKSRADKERELKMLKETITTSAAGKRDDQSELKRVCKARDLQLSEDGTEVIPLEIVEFKEFLAKLEKHQFEVYHQRPDAHEDFHKSYGLVMGFARAVLHQSDNAVFRTVYDRLEAHLRIVAALRPEDLLES